MLSLLPLTLGPSLVAAQTPPAAEPRRAETRRTVPAPGKRTRWTGPNPRWVVGAPKTFGISPTPVRFPARLDLPPTGRLVPWKAASTAKWTTYVRVLPLVGAPLPVSVAVRDLGSGFSIETISLYRGDGDRRLIGTLSSTVRGIGGAKRLVWNPKAATIRIEYEFEPPLVTPAGALRVVLSVRR